MNFATECIDFLSGIFRRMSPVMLSCFSGVVILTAFYVPFLWPLIFVALVPFFYAIHNSRDLRHSFLLGLIVGAFISGGTSLWYMEALPPSTSFSSSATLLVNFASWAAMVTALAPTTGLFALLVRATSVRSNIGYVVVPVAWVIFEYARMFSFLFVTFAPGIYNPAFYSAGFLGYPLADSEAWLQWGSVGGIYAMSFIVAVANYVLYRALSLPSTQSRKAVCSTVLILIVCSLVPVAALRSYVDRTANVSTVRVGLMSVYLPQSLRSSNYKELPEYQEQVTQGVASLAEENPNLIVLPEGGRFLDPARAINSHMPMVVDVHTVQTAGRTENVAYAGGTDGGVSEAIRAKSIVTPQGEYLIGLNVLPAYFLHSEDVLRAFGSHIRITPASWGDSVSIPETQLTASVMFCIEMIAPGFGSALVKKQGSDLLVVLLSQGRFRDSAFLARDTLRYLKVRAVEAGVPLVASADHSASYVIDRYGRTIMRIGGDGLPATASIDLPVQSFSTDVSIPSKNIKNKDRILPWHHLLNVHPLLGY